MSQEFSFLVIYSFCTKRGCYGNQNVEKWLKDIAELWQNHFSEGTDAMGKEYETEIESWEGKK